MKSTIYQHHLRASASFSYRHLLHSAMGELLLAHGRRHVAALRGLNDILLEEMDAGGPDRYSLDPDTSMNRFTYRAALVSAGAAIDAVDAVVTGELTNAFCATRPPGHHATRNQAMGFCFFSNVAVAAKYAASATASSGWPSSTSTCTTATAPRTSWPATTAS
jgi:acetoin utilization deacetylase AcuC-like enzyme